MEYVACNLCSNDAFEIIYEPLSELEKDINLDEKFRASGDEILIYQLVKCKDCGLIYVNPRPEVFGILKGYEEAKDDVFLSQVTARESTFKKSLFFIERYISHKGKILDVGTAGGSFLSVAKGYGWEVYGCEPNKRMCEWANKHYGIKIDQGDIFTQCYPSNFFDAVTIWDVLEHTTDPKSVLRECNRVLKPEGLLVVNYPDISTWIAKLMGRKWVFLLSVHLYYFTPETLKRMLIDCGFGILKLKPYFQELYLDYILKRARAYMPYLNGLFEKFFNISGFGKLKIPYWMGQTFAISKKENESCLNKTISS